LWAYALRCGRLVHTLSYFAEIAKGARDAVSSWGLLFRNGTALKLLAIGLAVFCWVCIYGGSQTNVDDPRRDGFWLYMFIMFMVAYFPPIALVCFLGVLQKRKYEEPETEEDDLRRIDNMYK
jgi:hypothetical protein